MDKFLHVIFFAIGCFFCARFASSGFAILLESQNWREFEPTLVMGLMGIIGFQAAILAALWR